jgi:menaquinone-dependent protoporphyrinogen IX oxidase
MKTILAYYSNNGSNRYLAKKIADRINCEIEQIRPRLNIHLFLLFGINFGNKKLRHNLAEFDRVILCGPIWMGKFISPLRSFVNKYKSRINELIFVTCCGSGFEMKDKKFGHGLVFNEVKNILKDKCIHCEALPITLVVPEDKKEDPNVVMQTRLSDENFKGEIEETFENFIKKVTIPD